MHARRRMGLAATLAAQLAEDIGEGRFGIGDHLSSQNLADRYGVSRSPVGEALRDLAAMGLLRHEPQRGYFVAERGPASSVLPPLPPDPVRDAYRALAEGRIEGPDPDMVSVNLLRDRYGLSQGQVQALVTRILAEGWLERRSG